MSNRQTLQGRIIKIISNQYTIEHEGKEYVASARGKLRLDRKPAVGDEVTFELIDGQARIHSIHRRRNHLLRPPLSNIDQAVIITSLKDPDFSDHLLNRLIFMVSLCDIEPVICFTKWDLLEDEKKMEMASIMNEYRKSGFRVYTSFPGSNDRELIESFKDRISVLCGQSGSGKSSLLNRLDPSLELKTQEISKALGRGKHTTRNSALFRMHEGWIGDTPGFSSLELERMNLEKLDEKLIPFQPYLGQCRYRDCRHLQEPDCAVKEAVENGKISRSLYDEYRTISEQADQNRKYKKY